MAFKLFGSPDKQPGTWVVFRVKEDDEKRTERDVKLRIRKVPGPKFDEISIQIYGKKIVSKNGVHELDKAKQLAFAMEKACFALVEVQNFPEIEVSDEEAVDMLGKAIGRTVNIGDKVNLDGTWNRATKDVMFYAYRDLLAFVINKADELTGFDATDEDELGKT